MDLKAIEATSKRLKAKGWRRLGSYQECPVLVGPRWTGQPDRFVIRIKNNGTASRHTLGSL